MKIKTAAATATEALDALTPMILAAGQQNTDPLARIRDLEEATALARALMSVLAGGRAEAVRAAAATIGMTALAAELDVSRQSLYALLRDHQVGDGLEHERARRAKGFRLDS